MALAPVSRSERGWGGHFMGVARCKFHRNTLLEKGGVRVIVSTIGAWVPESLQPYDEPMAHLGGGLAGEPWFYETMCFFAKQDGPYVDADVMHTIPCRANHRIHAASASALPDDCDLRADRMHEGVVLELWGRLGRGELDEEAAGIAYEHEHGMALTVDD